MSVRLLVLAFGLLSAPLVAGAEAPVNVVILREHGVGTATQAQPHLDKFVAIAAKENGWEPASKGKYETTRAGAEAFIKSDSPHFGVFTLAAFLEARAKYKVEAVGSATLATGGGQQYYIVSKTAGSLAECKGKTLATDHLDDPKFIEKVVADGAFKTADFTVVATRRFGQASTKLMNGEAECALIDDAQLAELAKLPDGAAVKQAWKSARLPPMVVVAFPAASAAEKAKMEAMLPKLCPANQPLCPDVGLQTLTTATPAEYAKVIAAYDRP